MACGWVAKNFPELISRAVKAAHRANKSALPRVLLEFVLIAALSLALVVPLKQQTNTNWSCDAFDASAKPESRLIIDLYKEKEMDAKPMKIPTPDEVLCPDPEPVGVEFLAELPEHVRAFFDEQRDLCDPK